MNIDPCYERQKCRPMTLVSGNIRSGYSQGFSGEGASNDSGIIENVDFHGFWTLRLRHLRKWGQHYYNSIIQYLVISPLTPKYMTLNDLDWLFRVKFCFRAGLAGWHRANSENNCVKTNEDRYVLSAVEIFGRDSSFWQYKVCADIRAGSLQSVPN